MKLLLSSAILLLSCTSLDQDPLVLTITHDSENIVSSYIEGEWLDPERSYNFTFKKDTSVLIEIAKFEGQ